MIPLPVETPLPPRLRPLGVKYWPAVMSSAPPLESSRTSWKTPLPNVSVPTTVARSRSCSAPVTISEADAVSPLTSTTIGAVGHDRVAGGAQRLLLDRAPARGDDRPVLEEGRGDELGLGHEAAAVVAQVEHEDLGAALLQLAQRRVDLGVRARAELRQAHDADLAAAVGAQLRGDDRHGHRRARRRSS